jgi:hypothetical protein
MINQFIKSLWNMNGNKHAKIKKIEIDEVALTLIVHTKKANYFMNIQDFIDAVEITGDQNVAPFKEV